jgi:SAM-dependent methyltransferase
MESVHRTFGGSIPEYYERFLVPFYFAPFAHDLVDRLHNAPNADVLELACGTGVVTQRLAAKLGGDGSISATDLNQGMIDTARKKMPSDHRIAWREADATNLPFGDGVFDAVVCQFGWMFFPDRARAAREAARVLRPGGQLLFNTWDSLKVNVVPAEVYYGIRECFSTNPPTFYDVPYGMFDPSEHERLVTDAGLGDVSIARVHLQGAKLDPLDAATGIIRGGPFVSEIEQRGADADSIVETVADRLRSRFGAEPFAAHLSAFVCSARKKPSPI